MDMFLASVVKVNQGMTWFDWSIVGAMILLLIGILMYCNRYMQSAADFLAASRCAGRYMLSISRGIAGFAVVNSVATFELFYKAGFASTWWAMLTAPIGLILSLVAWVTYRLRETRCFTLAQFYEVRYSRRFRIGAGMITFISGVVNYGIFPAVSVRFFMFFCRLPQYYQLWGINWDVYAVLLTIAIGMGMFFATCGGQIAIMVTDFVQGVFCNACFIVFILFIFKLGNWDVSGGYVSWEQIEASLIDTHGISQINPFDAGKIKDFNYWYFLIGILGTIYSSGSWQGGMGYAAAAKSPHESKMAGILATWRSLAQGLMIMLFPLALIVIMKHPDFTDLANVITETLAKTENPQLREQGLVPTGLSLIMPNGLLGLFVAVMFAAMLSTDDTYMHSWGSIFIQDVIMPFRKKPFTPKQHIWALRLSVVGVAVFAWLFSYFYRQTEYVFLFFAITGAIVSGAGAAIIGGLYWKKGTTLAAWTSYIVGAGIATTGIVLQQIWNNDRWNIHFGAWLNRTFDLNWSAETLAKFPINGQYVGFIAISCCAVLYVLISLIQHWLLKLPDFNLNKMLHRGEYDTANEHVDRTVKVSWLASRLGITREFTVGDKIIYGAAIAWTIGWFIIFIVYTSLHFINGHWENGFFESGVSRNGWMMLWHSKIYITLILALICTTWFLIGGIFDVIDLFRSLRRINRNRADDGSVIDGQNAGEKNESSKNE
ncbi:MAG: sodium:solute symporter [Lentisphaerae bacterium]|nr:sodium:solute symporter [Lentisphaerota bacterium]